MILSEIAHQRLHNQFITRPTLTDPVEIVRWLGAVQSQDYAGAKWALGLRLNDVKDISIEQAFNEGAILRTHVMRPTWHFVTPKDIGWLLALTAPRVKQAMAYYDRQLEIDEKVRARSSDILVRSLQGGHHLTRTELASEFEQAGIALPSGQHIGHVIMHAELDALICSGPRRGKQHTYALLSERAPQARVFGRDEALAELTLRYFTGHGPATLNDFVWWSGLTMSEVKSGLEMVKSHFVEEVVDGQSYWLAGSTSPAQQNAPAMALLPNYDEYIVGYTDRSASYNEQDTDRLMLGTRDNILFTFIMVFDGKVVGIWKRTVKSKSVIIETNPFAPLTGAQSSALLDAARRYGEFLELPVVMS